MDSKTHFKLLARYNQRMNQQVYRTAGQLDNATLNKDLGAFFHSILGTLNHIMVGDLFWLSRFSTLSERYTSLKNLNSLPTPSGLGDIIFPEFELLQQNREVLDAMIINWTDHDIDATDFSLDVSYRTSKGISGSRNFAEVLSHFFNHQTHHRGQISTLLSQHNLDIGTTDFLIDIPNNAVE